MKTTLTVSWDGNAKLVQGGLPPGEYEVTLAPVPPVAPNYGSIYANRTAPACVVPDWEGLGAVLSAAVDHGKRLRDWELACEALKKLGDGDG